MTASPDMVSFIVGLKVDAGAHAVKTALEQFIPGLQIVNQQGRFVIAQCDSAAYEKAFNAKLEYRTRTVNNINSGLTDVSDWTETKEAKIPDQIQPYVTFVELNRKVVLTD